MTDPHLSQNRSDPDWFVAGFRLQSMFVEDEGWECQTCGALTYDWELHRDWHALLLSRDGDSA